MNTASRSGASRGRDAAGIRHRAAPSGATLRAACPASPSLDRYALPSLAGRETPRLCALLRKWTDPA